jgi:hypothetical protein
VLHVGFGSYSYCTFGTTKIEERKKESIAKRTFGSLMRKWSLHISTTTSLNKKEVERLN